MSGLTQMPEDDEYLNDTFSRIAADNSPKQGGGTKAAKEDDERLSQSLLETFEMEDDDQFENLLDTVSVMEVQDEAQPEADKQGDI